MWFNLTDKDVTSINRRDAAGLEDLAKRLANEAAESQSEEHKAFYDLASDNEELTPEWPPVVSVCEDENEAWVLTWQLVRLSPDYG